MTEQHTAAGVETNGQKLGVLRAVEYLLNVNQGFRAYLGQRLVVVGGGNSAGQAAMYFANYAARGPAGAFSGPLIRGDAATVQQHLKLLRKLPPSEQVYVSLARSALTTLPVKNRAELSRVLGEAEASGKRRK